jgi:hypothetical protein
MTTLSDPLDRSRQAGPSLSALAEPRGSGAHAGSRTGAAGEWTEPAVAEAGGRAPLVRLALIWRVLPIAAAFSYAASIPIMHSDLFYTLANGRLMVERGEFPLASDPFTYAPAVPGTYDQPWGAQLLFFLAERLGGLAAVSLLHALAISSALAVLVWLLGSPVVRVSAAGLLRREGGAGPAATAGLALVGLALAGTNFNIRPQSLAFLPFAICLALVRTTGPRQRWAIPVMLALTAGWANVHGSFTLAVVIAGAHAAGTLLELVRRRDSLVLGALFRHRLALTLAALVGSCLNPAGPAVWVYALSVGDNPIVRQNIQEWWPTTALATLTAQLFFASLPVVIGTLILRRRHVRADDVLLLVGLGVLALTTQRAVMWFGLAAPVVVAGTLGAARARVVRELGRVNALLLLALTGIMLLSLPTFRAVNPLLAEQLRKGPGGGFLSADHPVGAVEYLATAPSGRVFSRMEWGGYLAWSLWPHDSVFLDARIERHPPQVWRDYFAILAAEPGWQSLLNAYGADYLVVEQAAFPELARQADASPEWRRLYADELSVVYARAA